MKTLLVLAPHPDLAETLRAGLSPEQYRVVHRVSVEDAEPLLAHGLASACLVDVELTGVQEVWILEKLRRRAPKCPIILYAGAKQPEWEEEAYLQGATHVLTKPVRIRMLSSLLERLWAVPAAEQPLLPAPEQVQSTAKAEPAAAASALQASYQSLGALRGFSTILTHSLDAEAIPLRHFFDRPSVKISPPRRSSDTLGKYRSMCRPVM